ncbi:MAG: ribosome-binding factor A [Phycisphaeraceae bacterium]|nr:MAG: ribosome-binding factor A [Phycisphaeraceae bacterium]
MTRRTDKVSSTLMRAVQERLARGLSDPRVRGLITVTGVEVTADLERAKIKITVMPDEHEALTLHGLKAAANRLRRDVSDKMHIRQMPQFEFVIDEGLKEQAKVMALLAKDRVEREAREAAKAAAEPASTPTDSENPA